MSSSPYPEPPPGSKSQPYVQYPEGFHQGPPAEGGRPPTGGYARPPTGGYSGPTGPPTGGYSGPPGGGGAPLAGGGGGYPRGTQPGMTNLTSEVNRMSVTPTGKLEKN